MIDLNTLNEGDIIMLPAPLTNPRPDRRTKHDWRLQTTIPEGMKFEVRVKTLSNFGYEGEIRDRIAAALRKGRAREVNGDLVCQYLIRPFTGHTHQTVLFAADGSPRPEDRHTELGQAVLDAAVFVPPGEEKLGDVLRKAEIRKEHWTDRSAHLIAVLLHHGKIDLADVRMAISVFDPIDDPDTPEWAAFCEKHSL